MSRRTARGDQLTHTPGTRSAAVHEVQVIQRAVPTSVELWCGGRDAGAVAARLKSFRGRVVDSLSQAEAELERIGEMARWGVS